MALGDIAQAMIPASVIPTALEAISQVSKSTSWKARASVLELLQVFYYLSIYHIIAHCGYFMIFLSLRFYVKTIFEILEVQNLPF